MSKVETATQLAINIANDNKHGYDQIGRWGTDYDCSSLLITAYQNAGIKVKDAGATYTGNMLSAFTKCGFKDITKSIDLKTGKGLMRGDVMLNVKYHTVIYIGDNKVVEANINEKGGIFNGKDGDQTGKEIWIRPYYNYPWNYVLRYPEAVASPSPSPAKPVVKPTATKTTYNVVIKTGTWWVKKAPDMSAESVKVISGSGVVYAASKVNNGWYYLDSQKGWVGPAGIKSAVMATATPSTAYHIVTKGETLSKIARDFNTTVANIVALNGIKNANLIYAGQKIRVN